MIVFFGFLSEEKDYLRFAPMAPCDPPVSSYLHEDTGVGPTYTGLQPCFHPKPNSKGEDKGLLDSFFIGSIKSKYQIGFPKNHSNFFLITSQNGESFRWEATLTGVVFWFFLLDQQSFYFRRWPFFTNTGNECIHPKSKI